MSAILNSLLILCEIYNEKQPKLHVGQQGRIKINLKNSDTIDGVKKENEKSLKLLKKFRLFSQNNFPNTILKMLDEASLSQGFSHQKSKVGHVLIANSKGILDKDEFLSFYIRILEDYINKITSSFFGNDLLNKLTQNEVLAGRILFDKLGNAKKLTIIKWSESNNIQRAFFNTLQGIKKINNPPRELVSEKQGFEVTYVLRLRL